MEGFNHLEVIYCRALNVKRLLRFAIGGLLSSGGGVVRHCNTKILSLWAETVSETLFSIMLR